MGQGGVLRRRARWRRGNRRRAVWWAVLPLVVAAVVVGLSGCGQDGTGRATPARLDASITVASFNFDESQLLGEVYAQALEAAGLPVDRQLRLGARELVQPALEQGLVDLVPEYVGSALAYAAPDRPLQGEPAAARRELKAVAGDDVVVLDAGAAQNQNGFAVRRETAVEHGLRTISDLGPVADQLVFGGPPECRGRRLCLGGLEDRYGLAFRRFQPLDSSGPLTAAALREGRVDVALLFTTDGDLADGRLVLLEDDLGLQPAENVVPVVRRAVLDRHGDEVVAAVDAVTAQLDTSTLTFLNRRLDRGDEVELVASEWLEARGLR